MVVLTDIRNRGVKDVFLLVCDGFKGRTRCGSKRVAEGHGVNLHYSPHPWFLPALITQILG